MRMHSAYVKTHIHDVYHTPCTHKHTSTREVGPGCYSKVRAPIGLSPQEDTAKGPEAASSNLRKLRI